MLAVPDADVSDENVPLTVREIPTPALNVLEKVEAVMGTPGVNVVVEEKVEQAPTLAKPTVRDVIVLFWTTNEKARLWEVVPLQEPLND